MSPNENDIRWYVFAIGYKKELDIRDELLKSGFDAYVPMHYTLMTVHGKKVRKQLPAVYGLVFVRGDRKRLLEFRETSPLKPYMFLKSHRLIDGTLQYIVVRDDDMDNFRRLNEVKGAELTYYKPEELRLEKGGRIKVMDGPFSGIVGIIQKLPHKHGKYLVVSLPDVAIAAVSIKPEYIQPLSGKIAKSADVEKDSKKLASLSLEVITQGKWRDGLSIMDEIDQLEQSLQGCKVFLPNDKANFYFAFYTAALANNKPADEYRASLEKILPKLKSNNLLLPVAHLLFYYDTKDEREKTLADNIIDKWDNTKYTDAQRRILKLRHVLAHYSTNGASNKQT